jgi:hypothetical protein
MTIALTSPVTGTAQTGFTAPTYTIVADSAVDSNVKRWIVTALGGTQVGVRVHSISDEFSVAFVKPKVTKSAPLFSSLSPQTAKVQFNRYWLIVRKGGIPASGLNAVPQIIRAPIDIAGGVDSYDAASIRGMLSLFGGVYTQLSSGLGDTLINGAM